MEISVTCCYTEWSAISGLKSVIPFLPAIFGVEVSAVERRLFVLLLPLGGLGISDPASLATHLFTSSVRATEHLVGFVVGFKCALYHY